MRKVMKANRAKDTKPELALAKALEDDLVIGPWGAHCVRNDPSMPGKPDFHFPGRRVIVELDGCAWHSCPKHAMKPKTNKKFWHKKFAANKARDRRRNREWKARGYYVYRVWECRLKKSPDSVVRRIRHILCTRGLTGMTGTVSRTRPA